jgi:hypothetical protein
MSVAEVRLDQLTPKLPPILDECVMQAALRLTQRNARDESRMGQPGTGTP